MKLHHFIIINKDEIKHAEIEAIEKKKTFRLIGAKNIWRTIVNKDAIGKYIKWEGLFATSLSDGYIALTIHLNSCIWQAKEIISKNKDEIISMKESLDLVDKMFQQHQQAERINQ